MNHHSPRVRSHPVQTVAPHGDGSRVDSQRRRRARWLGVLAALIATSASAQDTQLVSRDTPPDQRGEPGRARGRVAAAAGELDPERRFASTEVEEDAILQVLEEGGPILFDPVGTSSLVFRTVMAGPINAAFRPRSTVHRRGWLNEVAAYRIAAILEMDNVPPVVVRRFHVGVIRQLLDRDANWSQVEAHLLPMGSAVPGAFIYWVPDLQRSTLDQPAQIHEWRAWLEPGAAIPEQQKALARDLSNLLVFDYLIANRDRWSGGNVQPNSAGRLIVRDHNLALPLRLSADGHARLLGFLQRSQRFSRSMVDRVVAMNEQTLREAMEGDDLLLNERQIAGVLERRATLLSYVGALVETHGATEVLYFE